MLFNPPTINSLNVGGRLHLDVAGSTNPAIGDFADVGTIHYNRYFGDSVPIYNGTFWVNKRLTSNLTNVLADSSTNSAGPAAAEADSIYDLFIWDDSGTIRLTRGPKWTNNTTRATGVTAETPGMYVNTSAITNGPAASRGLYVGTIRTNATATVTYHRGTAGDPPTAAQLTVWNMYNQLRTAALVTTTDTGWTYTSATIQSLNGSDANRISFVMGLGTHPWSVSLKCQLQTAAVTSSFVRAGLTLDATTGVQHYFSQATPTSNLAIQVPSYTEYRGFPALGWHFVQATERSDGTNAATLGSGANTVLAGEFMM